MVQASILESGLQPEDYLWPLTSIRDALLYPEVESSIPSRLLPNLLRYHLPRLKDPLSAFKTSSSQSRNALNSSTITIPSTTLTVDIDAQTKSLAIQLSDQSQIDEIEAYLLVASCTRHSASSRTPEHEKQALQADHVVEWYKEECLAVPQVVMLIVRSADEDTSLRKLALDMKREIMENVGGYMEVLFRGFSTLAQKQVDRISSSDHAISWATYQLQMQEHLLDLLFLILYSTIARSASISEGLLRGSIMSAFGTYQANREIWDLDPDCQRLQLRIRDLLVVIAVESLCLGQVLSGPEADGSQETLLQSRDKIQSVHQFLIEQSEAQEISSWPMVVVCLGWSIVLQSLPDEVLPTSTNMDASTPFQRMAMMVLSPKAELFAWMETILSGSLFAQAKNTSGGQLANDMSIFRRKAMKDLLVGLSQVVRIEYIADQHGLFTAWTLLFGAGPPEASLSLSVGFWEEDFTIPDRRAILDLSRFPLEPTNLLNVMSALTAASSTEEGNFEAMEKTAARAADYFDRLSYFTHVINPNLGGIVHTSPSSVKTTKTLAIPGGASIPAGTEGTLIAGEDGGAQVVRWETQISGWGLLVELLRVGVLVRPFDEPALAIPGDTGSTSYSFRDLGIQGESSQTLSAGLKFLRSVMRSSARAAANIFARLPTSDSSPPGQTLLQLIFAVLENTIAQPDEQIGVYAIDILRIMIRTQSHSICQSLKASAFFEIRGRARGALGQLIQADSAKGEHGLTIAFLRLVLSLVEDSSTTDALLVQSALRLVVVEVWSQFSGWRYKDIARKYEVAALVLEIFDATLRHPFTIDNSAFSMPASLLVEVFISTASPLTYRPLIEILTQSAPLITRLQQEKRRSDSELVTAGVESSISFLATLLRIGAITSTSASALPMSIFSATVSASNLKIERLQLVDHFFELVLSPTTPDVITLATLKLLRTFLESTAADASRPSLAGSVRNAEDMLGRLAEYATRHQPPAVRSAVWDLLSTTIATQPGCVSFCTGSTGALKGATDLLVDSDELLDQSPQVLASALGYLQAVLESPGAAKAVVDLRTNDGLWQNVYEVATQANPALPNFSIAGEELAPMTTLYAYKVQAKANATALLAAELASLAGVEEETNVETTSQRLVLGLFRSSAGLQQAALSAIDTSCDPELHELQGKVVQDSGRSLVQFKSVLMACERDYGERYLYDGAVHIPLDETLESSVNLSVATLNLNWSALDAQISLTKSFRSLCESISTFTDGDPLAASAALKTAVAVAEELAEEYRGGDVMLAAQTERLGILSILLDTAMDADHEISDSSLLVRLEKALRSVIESPLFPPVISLRHPELPAIHKPVLRSLFLLLQRLSPGSIIDSFLDSGTMIALEAADILLDRVVRDQGPPSHNDLSLVIGILCEITKLNKTVPMLLDKMQEFGIVSRSLEVVIRAKLVGAHVAPPVSSVLLLHLALASNPVSAEKLAVFGILPAYSDNLIAVEAEQGRISTSNPAGNVNQAWCGMLFVIKALLSSLPDTASFAKSDVVPFVRVCSAQMLKALSWEGETPLSGGAIDELELVVDVFYGLYRSIGGLNEYVLPALHLLKSIRYALSHPRLLSTLFIPASEEEMSSLEKELQSLEASKGPVDLLDETRTPVLAEKTLALLRIARTILLTLSISTKAWTILRGQEDPRADRVLESEDEGNESTSSDPVGIFNDLHLLVTNIADRLDGNPEAKSVCVQIIEATGLLSTTQLLLRNDLRPIETEQNDDDMEIDGKRRVSLGTDRRSQLMRELIVDLKGMLGASESALGKMLNSAVEDRFGGY
ncbi:hypothetical protein P7C73_g4400, partial [Tremellales sp. Uapishka_1]